MAEACRLVVLISGGGSNLQAFIDSIAHGELHAEIVGVISNKIDATGLQRARVANIPTAVIDHKQFDSREQFDAELCARVQSFRPDLVVLAGFMRILTPVFLRPLLGKLLNIHPSLLPKYPGLHTHQRAIDAGDREAGATVHFVTDELDGGPAIVQARVPILDGDNAEQLAARVLPIEHLIYPLAVQLFANGRVKLEQNRAQLDGVALPKSGFIYQS